MLCDRTQEARLLPGLLRRHPRRLLRLPPSPGRTAPGRVTADRAERTTTMTDGKRASVFHGPDRLAWFKRTKQKFTTLAGTRRSNGAEE